MKMTMNELRSQIYEILQEAKKKTEKADMIKSIGPQVSAYGFYHEAYDFSAPLGAYNLYRQQGAVNWGPMTSDGVHVDQHSTGNPNSGPQVTIVEKDEQALRHMVREVIQNGLIDEDSAWKPFLKKTEMQPIFESSWEEVAYKLNENSDCAEEMEEGIFGFGKKDPLDAATDTMNDPRVMGKASKYTADKIDEPEDFVNQYPEKPSGVLRPNPGAKYFNNTTGLYNNHQAHKDFQQKDAERRAAAGYKGVSTGGDKTFSGLDGPLVGVAPKYRNVDIDDVEKNDQQGVIPADKGLGPRHDPRMYESTWDALDEVFNPSYDDSSWGSAERVASRMVENWWKNEQQLKEKKKHEDKKGTKGAKGFEKLGGKSKPVQPHGFSKVSKNDKKEKKSKEVKSFKKKK